MASELLLVLSFLLLLYLYYFYEHGDGNVYFSHCCKMDNFIVLIKNLVYWTESYGELVRLT